MYISFFIAQSISGKSYIVLAPPFKYRQQPKFRLLPTKKKFYRRMAANTPQQVMLPIGTGTRKDADQINKRFEYENIHRKTEELKTTLQQIPSSINKLAKLLCGVFLTKQFTFTSFNEADKIAVHLQDRINSVYRQFRMLFIPNITVEKSRFMETGMAEYTTVSQLEAAGCVVFEVEKLWNATINMHRATSVESQRDCLIAMRLSISTIREKLFTQFQCEIDQIVIAATSSKKRSAPDDPMISALSQRPRLQDVPHLPPIQSAGFLPVSEGVIPFRPQPIRAQHPLHANEVELINKCYNFLKATHFWSKRETHIPVLTYTALESVLIVTHTRSRIIAAQKDPGLDEIIGVGLPHLFPESQPEKMVQITPYQLKKFQDDVNALCARLLIAA